MKYRPTEKKRYVRHSYPFYRYYTPIMTKKGMHGLAYLFLSKGAYYEQKN